MKAWVDQARPEKIAIFTKTLLWSNLWFPIWFSSSFWTWVYLVWHDLGWFIYSRCKLLTAQNIKHLNSKETIYLHHKISVSQPSCYGSWAFFTIFKKWLNVGWLSGLSAMWCLVLLDLVYGLIWCHLVLPGFAWFCLVLSMILSMELPMVLSMILSTVLSDCAWFCLVLHDFAWFSTE